jgi:hypothetical protein
MSNRDPYSDLLVLPGICVGRAVHFLKKRRLRCEERRRTETRLSQGTECGSAGSHKNGAEQRLTAYIIWSVEYQ